MRPFFCLFLKPIEAYTGFNGEVARYYVGQAIF